jgi:F-type H+-transporting ATPase subunit epsilon
MTPFSLEIASPYRSLFRGKARSVSFRTPEGGITVLAGYEPSVTPLLTGILTYETEAGDRVSLVTSDGVVTITDSVLILTDSAEFPKEIDRDRVLAAKKRAEEHIAAGLDKYSVARAKKALSRAENRLKLLEKA